jgi:beta-N-acetylhexosaminidase
VRRLLARPLLLGVDQEGGRVSRLEPWIGPTPTAVALGRLGPEAAGALGAATARVLRSLGFNLDFAPVVDLCEPDAPNGIGDRAFSTDPLVVCSAAGAFLDGLQAGGVAGCLKHFPGLGSTRLDSHLARPTAAIELPRLEAEDLLPYRRLGPRAACVMVGHAAFPALDTTPDRPATLSPPIVDGWLRSRLGYRGLVVSDDMEMGAVSPLDAEGQGAVSAVAAGCDLLLYCADLDAAERAARALAARAAAQAAFARRLADAADAVRATARRWALEPGAPGSWGAAMAELRAAAAEASARA